ncbi:TIGR00341 family protein [Nocardioides sp.]|uniref:TIGR00341 family protein n=1 Tax=Nocardioides sp. TaxID=35761 RepID=UPI0035291772
MLNAIRSRLLPEVQRRSLEELTHDLDLTEGDARSKFSAFWTMLTLSSLIAGAGVLADSTATVIGAMIIAPLSTPIMGSALGLVKRDGTRAFRYVVIGALLVIGIGMLFAAFLPSSTDLLANSQISGRVSPGVFDLIAAISTGLAGAVALARKDVAAVLPGVAISISLVPPLVVVGICLGQGAVLLALGALMLFLSNLLALVLAGTFVFAFLGYATGDQGRARGSTRRVRLMLATLALAVATPLLISSAFSYYISQINVEASRTAEAWLSGTRGASVTSADLALPDYVIEVRTPGDLPSVEQLRQDLHGVLPAGLHVVVVTTVGDRVEVGEVP